MKTLTITEIIQNKKPVSFRDSPTTYGIAYEFDDVIAIAIEVSKAALTEAEIHFLTRAITDERNIPKI